MAHPLLFQTIDPRTSVGILDWFDSADADGFVVGELFARPVPDAAGERGTWFRQAMEENHAHVPEFFRGPLLAGRVDVPCQDTAAPTTNREKQFVSFRFPLTHFLLLPGHDPAEELGQLRGFFEWAAQASAAQGLVQNRSPKLQWFRCGRERGLEWALGEGMDAERPGWESDLNAWREQPWFAAWHRANLSALRGQRRGPHTWARMGPFEGHDAWASRQERLRPGKAPHV